MVETSVLQKIIAQSVLKEQSTIRPQRHANSRFPLAASLMLTSLVDVFSILVIYLLVNTVSAKQDFDVKFDVQLPIASHSDEAQSSLMVSLKNGQFFIDDKVVDSEGLDSAMKSWVEAHRDNPNDNVITIQADRETSFELLNPLLERAAFSGIRHFQLATLQEDRG